jgi:hypothetical protein
VYAKQNYRVFEAKVVFIFVAKLLCISIANWCVGKGCPEDDIASDHKAGRHQRPAGPLGFNSFVAGKERWGLRTIPQKDSLRSLSIYLCLCRCFDLSLPLGIWLNRMLD